MQRVHILMVTGGAACPLERLWNLPLDCHTDRSRLVVRLQGAKGSAVVTLCCKAGPETPASCQAGLDSDCNGKAGARMLLASRMRARRPKFQQNLCSLHRPRHNMCRGPIAPTTSMPSSAAPSNAAHTAAAPYAAQQAAAKQPAAQEDAISETTIAP